MGSNMAECHPVAFRWPMKAKLNGAKLIHVDPRFTRTSAVADLHVPIRAGEDIAFLGGLINYANAATIISDDFKDTEDRDIRAGADRHVQVGARAGAGEARIDVNELRA